MLDYLFKNFASQVNLHKAFKPFSSLLQNSIASPHYYSRLFANLNSVSQGKQLHARIISLGLEKHPILAPKLVTFYCTFDFLIHDAHCIIQASDILHPLPWNILIASYVRVGLCHRALSVYKVMLNKGIRPNNFTYPSVLKACSKELNVRFGKEVHKCIECRGLDWDLYVQNALINMYGDFGELDVARRIFDRMPERDVVSWNSIISAYACQGMWSEALKIFEGMQMEGIQVNVVTWNTIAGGCLRSGDYRGALQLISRMRTCGVYLDSVAVIIGLGACSHIGSLILGKEIHALAVRNYSCGLDNVKNSLITMYSRCKDLMHATLLFNLVEVKCVITWNSIISGYTHWDRSEEASFLFREMMLSGVEPNCATVASILPLCARVANLQHGREFHCYITRREGFKDHLLLWNALVDMYAKSGKISIAKTLFDLLSKKDEVTYTSLILGYGIQGEGKVALKLFEKMIKSLIKPDHVTMVAILSACSHSGLVVEGRTLFENMYSSYGITPRLEHFDCMIHLYGRVGLLKEAVQIFKRMPYQPTPEMWATLIGACQIHHNIYLGDWAAKKLLALRPQNSRYYILIANMYAAAGWSDKLKEVRTLMKDLEVSKAPGCDAQAGMSSFLVEDTSNARTPEIYSLLVGLNEKMEWGGNVECEDPCLEAAE